MSRNIVELPGNITVVFGYERPLRHYHCTLHREGVCEFSNMYSDNPQMTVDDVDAKIKEYFPLYPSEQAIKVLLYEAEEERLREESNVPHPPFKGWEGFLKFHEKRLGD